MTTMTRDEHLEHCKRRALEYLDAGEVQNAICSMMSDMRQHEETKSMNQAILALGLLIATNEDPIEARRWIVGFR
jgi:hypothetical protein